MERTSSNPGPLFDPHQRGSHPPAPDAPGNDETAPGSAPEEVGGGLIPSDALTPPKAPGSPPTEPPPGSSPEVYRDPWRDRLRIVWDRGVYLAVILAMYKLRMAEKLDYGTGIGLLLLAGIRVENLAEFLLRRAATAPTGRAAVALAMLQHRLQVSPDDLRAWFRG